jgi:hypothetical protein
MYIEPIALLVLGLEHIKRMSVIQDLDAASHARYMAILHVAIRDGRHCVRLKVAERCYWIVAN